jgi:hypothetical protein
MGWRRTGTFHPAQEVLVMTCDVCERDIGHEDGRRPKSHYEIVRLPNLGAIDDQDPPALICSPECLRSFAAQESGPDRVPFQEENRPRGKPRGKPRK